MGGGWDDEFSNKRILKKSCKKYFLESLPPPTKKEDQSEDFRGISVK